MHLPITTTAFLPAAASMAAAAASEAFQRALGVAAASTSMAQSPPSSTPSSASASGWVSSSKRTKFWGCTLRAVKRPVPAPMKMYMPRKRPSGLRRS